MSLHVSHVSVARLRLGLRVPEVAFRSLMPSREQLSQTGKAKIEIGLEGSVQFVQHSLRFRILARFFPVFLLCIRLSSCHKASERSRSSSYLLWAGSSNNLG
jgi:hypothetical protein